jgi:hypothetical protein
MKKQDVLQQCIALVRLVLKFLAGLAFGLAVYQFAVLPIVWVVLDAIIEPYMALKFWNNLTSFGLTDGIPIHLDRETWSDRVGFFVYFLKPSIAFFLICWLLHWGFRLSLRRRTWISGAIAVVVLSGLGLAWNTDRLFPDIAHILTTWCVVGMVLLGGVNAVYRKPLLAISDEQANMK